MKIHFILLAAGLVLAAGASQAKSESLSLCGSTKLRELKESNRCRTSKNGVYQLVKRTETGKEVWRDTATGLLWSDVLTGRYSHAEALQICQKPDIKEVRANLASAQFSLPTKMDFEVAEANGLREVLPRISDGWFWTSSVSSQDSDYAYYFNGYNGRLDDFVRSLNVSVRCVSHGLRETIKNKHFNANVPRPLFRPHGFACKQPIAAGEPMRRSSQRPWPCSDVPAARAI